MNKSYIKIRCGGAVLALFLLFNFAAVSPSTEEVRTVEIKNTELPVTAEVIISDEPYDCVISDIEIAYSMTSIARMMYMMSGEVPDTNAVLEEAGMLDYMARTADVKMSEFYKLEAYTDPEMPDFGIVFKVTFTAGEKAGEYAGEYVVTEWGELPSPKKQ